MTREEIEFERKRKELRDTANLVKLRKEVEAVLSLHYEKPFLFKYVRGGMRKYGIMLLERSAWYKLYGGPGGGNMIANMFDLKRNAMDKLIAEAEQLEREDKQFRAHIRTVTESSSLPFIVEGYAKADSDRLKYIYKQIETLKDRAEQIKRTHSW